MNQELLDKIRTLSGELRAETFQAAAKFILEHDCQFILETGCYRGIPADGQSTVIFGLLAKETGGQFHSYEISQDSLSRASLLAATHGLRAEDISFHHMDSVFGLSALRPASVRFAYLDSFDHDPNNPGQSQRHELAEIGAILGKMLAPCAILLDDCIPETGGKTLLGSKFLEDQGWKLRASGYQLFYTME